MVAALLGDQAVMAVSQGRIDLAGQVGRQEQRLARSAGGEPLAAQLLQGSGIGVALQHGQGALGVVRRAVHVGRPRSQQFDRGGGPYEAP